MFLYNIHESNKGVHNMPCYPRDKAVQGQEVALQIQYYDSCGDKVCADETPIVRITDLDNNLILTSESDDVDYLGDGLYQYIYRVPTDGDSGLWNDEWSASIDGAEINTSFIFTVVGSTTGLLANIGPGKIRIADDVSFDFSDAEIYGINILLKYLKSRLRSTGLKAIRDENGAFITDGYGTIITEECDVFDDEILVIFLCQALSEFNLVPFFTSYTFGDQVIQTLFAQLVVEAAYVFALASQSLLEKGRDFTITEGGISYQPPQLGDFIQSHYGTWLASYRENLRFVKNSIRPGPRSFGTYSNMGSSAPAFTRLRHLRSRRIV